MDDGTDAEYTGFAAYRSFGPRKDSFVIRLPKGPMSKRVVQHGIRSRRPKCQRVLGRGIRSKSSVSQLVRGMAGCILQAS
jgi:hypothetical protein